MSQSNIPISDIELLGYRIAELKESTDRLAYMHGIMLQTLKDISRQSKDNNEKAIR